MRVYALGGILVPGHFAEVLEVKPLRAVLAGLPVVVPKGEGHAVARACPHKSCGRGGEAGDNHVDRIADVLLDVGEVDLGGAGSPCTTRVAVLEHEPLRDAVQLGEVKNILDFSEDVALDGQVMTSGAETENGRGHGDSGVGIHECSSCPFCR